MDPQILDISPKNRRCFMSYGKWLLQKYPRAHLSQSGLSRVRPTILQSSKKPSSIPCPEDKVIKVLNSPRNLDRQSTVLCPPAYLNGTVSRRARHRHHLSYPTYRPMCHSNTNHLVESQLWTLRSWTFRQNGRCFVAYGKWLLQKYPGAHLSQSSLSRVGPVMLQP